MKKINIAVIGLGVGMKHAQIFNKNKFCNLKIICDLDKSKIIKYKKMFPNTKFTSNERDIFLDESIDLVSIASYDNHHFNHVCKSLLKNKNVIVEKPLCLKELELKKLFNILKNKNKFKIFSNFTLRGNLIFHYIFNLIRKGSFGKIYHCETSYNYGRIGKIINGWRGKIPYYSVTHGGTIHLIDLILWLLSTKVDKVISVGNNISTKGTSFKFKDCVSSLCYLEDGSTAKFTANFGSVSPHHHRIEIYGTKKTFYYDFNKCYLYDSRNKLKKPFLFKNHLVYDKGFTIKQFINNILKGKDLKNEKNSIFNSMSASLAIEKSLKTGKFEKVKKYEFK